MSAILYLLSNVLFLSCVSWQIDDGRADTLLKAILTFCNDNDLPLRNKLAGIGSDGAPVMIGGTSGLAKQLKESVSIVINNL